MKCFLHFYDLPLPIIDKMSARGADITAQIFKLCSFLIIIIIFIIIIESIVNKKIILYKFLIKLLIFFHVSFHSRTEHFPHIIFVS